MTRGFVWFKSCNGNDELNSFLRPEDAFGRSGYCRMRKASLIVVLTSSPVATVMRKIIPTWQCGMDRNKEELQEPLKEQRKGGVL